MPQRVEHSTERNIRYRALGTDIKKILQDCANEGRGRDENDREKLFSEVKEKGGGGLPGGPVVKTLSSNARGVGLIPGWSAKIPYTLRPKKPTHRSNIVTNSIKTLKMVHIKKFFKKKSTAGTVQTSVIY